MGVLIQRLWQSGKSADVIDRLQHLDPGSATSDTGLLAYLALAKFEIGDVEAAKKVVADLSKRTNDPNAVAWAIALSARFGHMEPKAALTQYEAALVRSPDNSVIRFLVGEAYAHMGETELAMAAWRRAAELSPSWMSPHLNIARTLAASGRAKDAVVEAEAAYRAAPDRLETITALATIRYKALEESPRRPGRREKPARVCRRHSEAGPRGGPDAAGVRQSAFPHRQNPGGDRRAPRGQCQHRALRSAHHPATGCSQPSPSPGHGGRAAIRSDRRRSGPRSKRDAGPGGEPGGCRKASRWIGFARRWREKGPRHSRRNGSSRWCNSRR